LNNSAFVAPLKLTITNPFYPVNQIPSLNFSSTSDQRLSTILVGWLYKVAFVFNATVDAGKTLPQKLVLRTELAEYTKPAKKICANLA
jgi:hypothetical protein